MANLHPSVAEALTHALTGLSRLPGDVGGAAEAFGGNAGLARALNDIGPDAKLPRKGTAKRRRYDADLRRIQRNRAFETGAARERRRPSPDFLRRVLAGARIALAGPRLLRARRGGVRMILAAWIRWSDECDFHVMPAPAAGRDVWQSVPDHRNGGDVGPALDAWEDGRVGDAGEELTDAFLRAYTGGDVVLCGPGVEGAAVQV